MEPDYTFLGERLAERVAPLQPPAVDVQYDYAFGNLCEAMMRMYENVALLVDPGGDWAPWEVLFNVNVCPEWALPWLAQVVGVRLPSTVTGNDARAYIKGLTFEQVGKPATIKAVIGMYLTGGKQVYFRERDDGDAYMLEVVTIADETPDVAAVLRAIKMSVPAGIVVDYHTVGGWDYQAMTTEGGPYSDLPTKFSSYRNMSGNIRIA
jgi:hypothetical protein